VNCQHHEHQLQNDLQLGEEKGVLRRRTAVEPEMLFLMLLVLLLLR
jgi:hypothetical protein